ncbi:MAG: hypothetical protein ACOYJE_03065 [Bacteroidaceae bacterium]
MNASEVGKGFQFALFKLPVEKGIDMYKLVVFTERYNCGEICYTLKAEEIREIFNLTEVTI